MANDYNRISEAQYEATMRRHGTADWTSEDGRIQREYLAQNAPVEEEVETSPGNSSSQSTKQQNKTEETGKDSHQSPAQTTENPSVKGQKDNSSASSTGTSGQKTDKEK